jgi:15-cis-phytoene synthase
VLVSPHNANLLASAAILAKQGRTFHLASKMLSPKSRAMAVSLYGICRAIDDVADGTMSLSAKETQLQTLRQAVTDGSVFRDTALQTLHQHNPDTLVLPMLELIDGSYRDAEGWPINTTADLIDFAYEVAGTVGAMMFPILGVTRRDAMPAAISLGIAMQLTNIARDVAEDRTMGRCYLPREWAMHSDVAALPAMARERALVCEVLNMAELYYQRAASGFAAIPARNRLAIVAAAMMYREIGVQIARRGYSSEVRVVVGRRHKVVCLLRAFSLWMHGIAKSFSAASQTG